MSPGGRPGRRQLLLAGMTLANAMVLVDQTAVPLTLPAIIRQFGVSSGQVQWVLTASLLPLAALLVPGGRLGDLADRRRVFLAGTLLFAGASAAGGLAPTFALLLTFRVLQGACGALMLPATVAIVSSAFPGHQRGRALGAMGGAAAIAAAAGPTIGGALTSALSWRAVLLINVPLAAATILLTMRVVPPDQARGPAARIDLAGAAALGVTLAGAVFALAQTPAWGWTSPLVLGTLIISAAAAVVFALAEHRSPDPLLNLALLRNHPDYLAATLSQAIAGMAAMGLALLFPLLLILNLQMPPALAGLALIPVTLPMIIVAPLAGRWYDRAGGRWPLTTGFAIVLLAGLLLALGVQANAYIWILPGLLAFGTGLAVVLTVNDPVTLDTIPAAHHGQASGVSATAEQFGGALGIASFYLLFHATYLHSLHALISRSPRPDTTPRQLARLRDALQTAEQTGLQPKNFPADLATYLIPARTASDHGYAATFLATSALAAVALIVMLLLIRTPARRSRSGPADRGRPASFMALSAPPAGVSAAPSHPAAAAPACRPAERSHCWPAWSGSFPPTAPAQMLMSARRPIPAARSQQKRPPWHTDSSATPHFRGAQTTADHPGKE